MFEFFKDNPQFVFFLIVFVIVTLQKMLAAARAKKEEGQDAPEPSLEEIFRPKRAPYVPPPLPPVPTAVPPPLTRSASPQAPARPAADYSNELARQSELEERLRKIRQAKAQKMPSSPVAPLAPLAPVSGHAAPPRRASTLMHRLRRPQELRRAILLKEILDKPLALRR